MSAPIVRYARPPRLTWVEGTLALGELCKARLSSLVLATSSAGYLLALPAGERILKQMWHLDVMYQARQGKSCLTSSRLDSVARWLNCPFQKTVLDMNTWMEAEAEVLAHFANGRANYNYIVKHCDVDLKLTEFVYDHFKPMIRCIQRRG